MQKRNFFALIALVYEFARLIFIVLARPALDIKFLPLSWYTAFPLLALPLVLLYRIYTAGFADNFANGLYILIKAANLPAFAAYLRQNISNSKLAASMNEFYYLKQLGFLVIFFLIDVILAGVMIAITKKQNPEGD